MGDSAPSSPVSRFTFLIVNIKLALTTTYECNEYLFTFLIVNIKPELALDTFSFYMLFTFLIVNIKLLKIETIDHLISNLHSS